MENAVIYLNNLNLYNNGFSNVVVGPKSNTVNFPGLSITGGITGPTGSSSGSYIFSSETVTGTADLNPDIPISFVSGGNHYLPPPSREGMIKTLVNKNPNCYLPLDIGVSTTLIVNKLLVDSRGDLYFPPGVLAQMGNVPGLNLGISRWIPSGDTGSWYNLNNNLITSTLANPSIVANTFGNTGILVGGTFTSIGGVSANNIALWTPNVGDTGGVWSNFGTGLNNQCTGLAYDPFTNYIYTAGDFTTAGGVGATGAARYNLATNTWSGMGVGITRNTSTASILPDGKGNVYYTGAFTSAGGVTSTGIAMWSHPDNRWYTLGSGLGSASGACLEKDASGNIYVGGSFTVIPGTVNTARMAMWQPGNTGGTGTWYSIGSFNGAVDGLFYSDITNTLYITGSFNGVNNDASLGRPIKYTPVLGVTGAIGTFSAILGNSSNFNTNANSITVDNSTGDIYVSGAFTLANSSTRAINGICKIKVSNAINITGSMSTPVYLRNNGEVVNLMYANGNWIPL